MLSDFLGPGGLEGAVALDVGCSTGFVAAELASQGAVVTATDIDVSGLEFARERFGSSIRWVRADGSDLPAKSGSVDVVVLNHIYEHAVDPDALIAEIERVLRPDGVVYLGLGNRYGVVEPHYRLPFLSWLPPSLGDRYVRAAGRGEAYHERFRSRRGLRRMCRRMTVWDYTYTVVGEPTRYRSDDMVSGPLAGLPEWAWRAAGPVMPTYIWVASPGSRAPAPARRRWPPRRLDPL